VSENPLCASVLTLEAASFDRYTVPVTTAELLEHLRQEAMKLPEPERLQLAREIEESVEADEDALHPEWHDEIERRVMAIRAGESTGKPATQAIADIRARLQRR
jgi:putative addiction module component (TIGR02574 family)